jgi:hypothetical protein
MLGGGKVRRAALRARLTGSRASDGRAPFDERGISMKLSIYVRRALLACVLAIALAPRPAQAEAMETEAGLGIASVLCSLLYGPVKVLYATGGMLVGGLAWGLSGGDSEVLHAVITPSVRGDYVITPTLLRGERPIQFFGQDPEYHPEDVAGAPAEADPVY